MRTFFEKIPFEKISFKKIPFGKTSFKMIPSKKIPFDTIHLKKIPFEKISFDKIPFDKIPFENYFQEDFFRVREEFFWSLKRFLLYFEKISLEYIDLKEIYSNFDRKMFLKKRAIGLWSLYLVDFVYSWHLCWLKIRQSWIYYSGRIGWRYDHLTVWWSNVYFARLGIIDKTVGCWLISKLSLFFI